MLIVLIIIIMLIGASIVGTIYSNFLVFYSNFSESENYHKAYYNTISALERGELVIKQRKPGYKGSGGWVLNVATGTYNNGTDKPINSNFSYISKSIRDFLTNPSTSTPKTSIFRDINSRTTRIPSLGNGNVEGTLAANDSTNYNMMDYENAEVFLLYYDSTPSNQNPYSNTTNITKRQGTSSTKIEGKIRLPARLRIEGDNSRDFGKLDIRKPLVGGLGEVPSNDAIVDRQVRGKFGDNSYTIYSTQDVAGDTVYPNTDNAIRENDINNNILLRFYNSWNPLTNRGSASRVKIISQNESNIKNLSFNNLWRNSNTSENKIRFSLLNLLESEKNKIYPFLEYYIDFGGKYVSDKYYTLKAKGNYADYEVDMTVQKPTVKETILSSFTSIF